MCVCESVIAGVSPLSQALSESSLEGGGLADEISDSIRESLLRAVVGCGLDTQNKLVL